MSLSYEQDLSYPKVWHLKEGEQPIASFHEKILGPPSGFQAFQTKEDFLSFEYQKALLYCYRRLSYKSFYSKQLFKELKEYHVTGQTILKVLAELQSLGYINDKEWVRRFIQIKKSCKLGKRKIEALLYHQGVDTALSTPLLQEEMKEGIEEIIKNLIKKKYARLDLSEPKQKNKVITALLRRGYLLDELSFLF